MTEPRYLLGWAAVSQVPGRASPSDYAWNVNLNDGNSNRNHQTNHNQVRAVRAGDGHEAVSFSALRAAWREARRGKQPSMDQFSFDADWVDKLFELERRLKAGTWSPAPPTCFIATAPKAREIHAPAFADRVVHHWLVPQLEAVYEPTFIHDSYSNRKGKGTHAAVGRLRSFVRQVQDGQGGGYYLQLDIKNFFNRIHRPTLYALLKSRMERARLPITVRQAVHALLRRPVTEARFVGTARERAQVPPHKRLENAPPGCGIAIGNLSSQFFANVYLNELDQFVKHTLRAPRYLRYVDDFVLVHHDREQLVEWQARIERFLADRLRLELKAGSKLQPLSAAIDFLGYVIFPRHTLVRRRVVGHARSKLTAWERRHVRRGRVTRDRRALESLRSMWASYLGHFLHANCHRLLDRIGERFPWLYGAIS